MASPVRSLAPLDATYIRHNTREHAQLSTSSSFGLQIFGSQSPAATNPTSNDFSSFLEVVMTEEERRTRTRHLPEVEGFAALSKSECKSDLKLARGELEHEDGTAQPTSADDSPFVRPQLLSTEPVTCPSSFLASNLTAKDTVVESVTSFNPNRPPESTGNNKKRRILRWEKNPNEIETDLRNYERTVAKTYSELTLTLEQQEQVESVGNTLRGNFLRQLEVIRSEERGLMKEMTVLSHRFEATAAGKNLGGAGTRKRGAAVLKDVIACLKAAAEKVPVASFGAHVTVKGEGRGGIGGVVIGAKDTEGTPAIASSWLLPGDAVTTAYGAGVISRIIPGVPTVSAAGVSILHPPRVAVKLDYGQAFMLPSECTLATTKASMTDAQFVVRWKMMLETGQIASSFVDCAAMEFAKSGLGYWEASGDAEIGSLRMEDVSGDQEGSGREEDPMDVEASGSADADADASGDTGARLITFGSNLLPTPGGRGHGTAKLSLPALRQSMQAAATTRMTTAAGFTSESKVVNVPSGFSEWEDCRKDIYMLKSQLLQARKIVRRQEAAKSMMTKTLELSTGYLEKQEETFAEIKTDLDNMKRKCATELDDLGIDGLKAKEMLYKKLNETVGSEPLPLKPKKRTKPTKDCAPPRASKRTKRGGRVKGVKGGTAKAAETKTVGEGGEGEEAGGDVGELLTATAEALVEGGEEEGKEEEKKGEALKQLPVRGGRGRGRRSAQ